MKINQLQAILVFDIDGVVRDVGGSYRRALADTVEKFTDSAFRPTMSAIDELKSEGIWNNDWEASQELVYRYRESQGQTRADNVLDYQAIVDFFQSRYRGADPNHFDGYIRNEPLLISANYLNQLHEHNIGWGFFSGATRGSAEYVLTHRLGLSEPVLVSMEDAPSKPNPEGLFNAVGQILDDVSKISSTQISQPPVIYVGDTVADIQTAIAASVERPNHKWLGVGVLPPHAQTDPVTQANYQAKLEKTGAISVCGNVEELSPEKILNLIAAST